MSIETRFQRFVLCIDLLQLFLQSQLFELMSGQFIFVREDDFSAEAVRAVAV